MRKEKPFAAGRNDIIRKGGQGLSVDQTVIGLLPPPHPLSKAYTQALYKAPIS